MATANCARKSWISGLVLGLLVWLATAGTGPLAWFEGLFLGILAAVLLARTLIWLTCEGVGGMDASEWQPSPAAVPATPVQVAPVEVASARPLSQPVASQPVTDASQPPAPVQTASKAQAAPDDLKELKGVGPKLEAVLHQNGITRFGQIAGWTDDDIDRYAEALGSFGGRIRSEDWVGQARLLAAGGETEHSLRVQKGEFD